MTPQTAREASVADSPARMPQARSLRAALFGWIALGLLAAVLLAALGTYAKARDEANVLFDRQLQEMAASLTGMPLTAGASPSTTPDANALVVQVWDRNGVRVYLSHSQIGLPQRAQLGFETVNTNDGQWRVFSMLAGAQVVQVAQPMSARRELAASMALRTIVPLLAVVPFLAAVVWLTVARGLRPLNRLAAGVRERSAQELTPLPEQGQPREVVPLVHALNGLLGRLDHALDAQRAFIADAAHELRTPLTAVDLQAQLAQRARTESERSAAFAELSAGLARATHLVEQLLTLAREEPGVAERPMTEVDLVALAREVVAEHAPVAAARGVDLGVTDLDGGIVIRGDVVGLRTLLSNLVDNAIRYTPREGRIDVGVAREDDRVTLAVRDTGPGIREDERPRVFDRFYRAPDAPAPGSGLGLSIVARIAERHGASIELGPGLGPRDTGHSASGGATKSESEGLSVTVRFPA